MSTESSRDDFIIAIRSAFLKKGKTDEIFAASAEVKGVGVGF